jgi:AcrR family transcriptional regulator
MPDSAEPRRQNSRTGGSKIRGSRTKTAATRTNDPEKTKADILAVAFKEFADRGFAGARVDEIAAQTRTSKRMIYYYFESKDGLYKAVLADYYTRLRGAERSLHLEDHAPLEALRELVGFTFDWHATHPEGVRLIMTENIHQGRYVAELPTAETLNSVVINSVRSICERGVKAGVIRPEVDPVDLYQSIAALNFFNVSNRYTFSKIFDVDMASPKATAARRESVIQAILSFVKP